MILPGVDTNGRHRLRPAEPVDPELFCFCLGGLQLDICRLLDRAVREQPPSERKTAKTASAIITRILNNYRACRCGAAWALGFGPWLALGVMPLERDAL